MEFKQIPFVFGVEKPWHLQLIGTSIREYVDVFSEYWFMTERRACRFGIRSAALTVYNNIQQDYRTFNSSFDAEDMDIPEEINTLMDEADKRLLSDEWWLEKLPNTTPDEFRLQHTIVLGERDDVPEDVLGDEEWQETRKKAHQEWFVAEFMDLWNRKLMNATHVANLWGLDVNFVVTNYLDQKGK